MGRVRALRIVIDPRSAVSAMYPAGIAQAMFPCTEGARPRLGCMSDGDSNVTRSAAEWEAFAGALRRAALAVSDARGDGVLGELVAALADILAVDAAFIAVQEDD